jgi:hypothetical protein
VLSLLLQVCKQLLQLALKHNNVCTLLCNNLPYGT